MGQKAFISDADTALANLIWNGIENEPAIKKHNLKSRADFVLISKSHWH